MFHHLTLKYLRYWILYLFYIGANSKWVKWLKSTLELTRFSVESSDKKRFENKWCKYFLRSEKKADNIFPISLCWKRLNSTTFFFREQAGLFMPFDVACFKLSEYGKKWFIQRFHNKWTIGQYFGYTKSYFFFSLQMIMMVFKPFFTSAIFPRKQTLKK